MSVSECMCHQKGKGNRFNVLSKLVDFLNETDLYSRLLLVVVTPNFNPREKKNGSEEAITFLRKKKHEKGKKRDSARKILRFPSVRGYVPFFQKHSFCLWFCRKHAKSVYETS